MSIRNALLLPLVLVLGACAMGQTSSQPDLYTAMSDADIALAAENMQLSLETLPDNHRKEWVNSGNTASGSVTPTRTFVSDSGSFCRDYVEVVTLAGQTADYNNTACRNDAGRWIWTD